MVLDAESNELMVEIEQRLLDANRILLDINGKIKDAFLDERLQLLEESKYQDFKDKNDEIGSILGK